MELKLESRFDNFHLQKKKVKQNLLIKDSVIEQKGSERGDG